MDPSVLKCHICEKIITEPKLLTCGHQFCAGCLRNDREKNGLTWTITCHVCGNETRVPENGVGGLPTNLVILDILKQFAGENGNSSKKGNSPKTGAPISPPTTTGPDRIRQIKEEVRKSQRVIERNKEVTLKDITRLETCQKMREEEELFVGSKIEEYFKNIRNYIAETERCILGDLTTIVEKNQSIFKAKRDKLDNIMKALNMGQGFLDNIIANPTGPDNFYNHFRKHKTVIEFGNTDDYADIDLFNKVSFTPEIQRFNSVNLIGELQSTVVNLDSYLPKEGRKSESEADYMVPIPLSQPQSPPGTACNDMTTDSRYAKNLAHFSSSHDVVNDRIKARRSTVTATPMPPPIPERVQSRRGSLKTKSGTLSSSLPTQDEYPLGKHSNVVPRQKTGPEVDRGSKCLSTPGRAPPPPPRIARDWQSERKNKKVSDLEEMTNEVMVNYAPAMIQSHNANEKAKISTPSISSQRVQGQQPSDSQNGIKIGQQPTRPPKSQPIDFSQALRDNHLFRKGLSLDKGK